MSNIENKVPALDLASLRVLKRLLERDPLTEEEMRHEVRTIPDASIPKIIEDLTNIGVAVPKGDGLKLFPHLLDQTELWNLNERVRTAEFEKTEENAQETARLERQGGGK